MRVNNYCANFFEVTKFEKLNGAKKFVVVMVSILPVLTLIGIIASPFLWRKMVLVLSQKKITLIKTKSPVSVLATGSKGVILKLTSKTVPKRKTKNHDTRKDQLAGNQKKKEWIKRNIERTAKPSDNRLASSTKEVQSDIKAMNYGENKKRSTISEDNSSDNEEDRGDEVANPSKEEAFAVRGKEEVDAVGIKGDLEEVYQESSSDEERDDEFANPTNKEAFTVSSKEDEVADGNAEFDEDIEARAIDVEGSLSTFSEDQKLHVVEDEQNALEIFPETPDTILPLLSQEQTERQIDELTKQGIPILLTGIVLPNQLLNNGDFLLRRDKQTFFLSYNKNGEIIENVQLRPDQDILLTLTELKLWPKLSVLKEEEIKTRKQIATLEEEIAILEKEVEKKTKEKEEDIKSLSKTHEPPLIKNSPKGDSISKRKSDISFIKSHGRFFQEGQRTPILQNGEYYVVNLNSELLLKYKTRSGKEGVKNISSDADLLIEIQNLKKLW